MSKTPQTDNLRARIPDPRAIEELIASHSVLEETLNDVNDMCKQLAKNLLKLEHDKNSQLSNEARKLIKAIVTRSPGFVCCHNVVVRAEGKDICNDCGKELEHTDNFRFVAKTVQSPNLPKITPLSHNLPYGTIQS